MITLTDKSINGTSFHGHEFPATLNQLRKMLGEPNSDGDFDKVFFEWVLELESGDVVSLYDWKQGFINPDRPIDWHIGGHSKILTGIALGELYKLMSKI